MRKDIKSTIEHYFSSKQYVNPLDKGEVLTAAHRKLIYEIIGELRHRFERELTHSSDGNYDLSEKITIKNHIVLRLSFLGPYVHLHLGNARRHLSDKELDVPIQKIKEVLSIYEFLVLTDEEVEEEVGWLERGDSVAGAKIRVWNCIFCEY